MLWPMPWEQPTKRRHLPGRFRSGPLLSAPYQLAELRAAPETDFARSSSGAGGTRDVLNLRAPLNRIYPLPM